MHRRFFWGLLVAGLLAFPSALYGQARPTAPTRIPLDLQQITRRAGTIFAGRVVSIAPVRVAGSEEMACVAVTVQVEQGVRGTRAGQPFTFREWAGLWSQGARYRVGERLMLFLYAPSTLGLTSPVGGPAGRFAVDRSGRLLLSPQQQEAIRISPVPVRVLRGGIAVRDFARSLRRTGGE